MACRNGGWPSSRVPDAVRREVPLRRAGTQKAALNSVKQLGPGSAAHHFVLRSVRGTRFPSALRRLLLRRGCRLALGTGAHDTNPVAIGEAIRRRGDDAIIGRNP